MTSAYGREALRREEAKVRAAKPGVRDRTLYDASYEIGRLRHGGEVREDDMVDTLFDAALACGLSEADALNAIRSGLARSEDRPRQAPPAITSREEAAALVDDYEDEVIDLAWFGRNGPLCTMVMCVVIRLARLAGGPRDVPLAIRRVAAEAGITRPRAARGLHLLHQEGYLRRTKHARGGYPTHYTLTLPTHHRDTTTSDTPSPTSRTSHASRVALHRSTPTLSSNLCAGERKVDRPPPEHDAFRDGALGETGWTILDWLTRHPGPHHQAAVALGSGISPGTVNRHVRPDSPLVTYGLVERDSTGRVAAPGPAHLALLDKIAHDRGTAGVNAKFLSELRAEYRGSGTLDDDGYWLDRTGERRGHATWLADPTTTPPAYGEE